MIDHYYTLGIRMGASPAEIKAAYRRAALIHHPDRGGDAVVMKRVNAAYEVLSNPDRRANYDRELAQVWALAEKWARIAIRRAAQSAPPPPPPHRTARRPPPRPAPAPWRHWPVRFVMGLIVAAYCCLAYSFALAGPWGLLALIPVSGWYVLGAYWVYDVTDEMFLR